MNELNVIYQFNEKYVPYAGVSMTSLLVNNTEADSINIYVLGEGLSEGSVAVIRELVEGYGRYVSFPDTAPLLARFEQMGMIPYRGAYSVYLRLFFTEIEEVSNLSGKRVIYLDSDTIVDGSLIPLVNQDLHKKSIGMVPESIRDDYKLMIGMSSESDYYNSGVILFDVDKWIANGYPAKLADHILNVRSSYIGDQDFLNIVCEGDIARLPVIYNYQPLHGRYTPKQYFMAYGMRGYYSDEELSEAAGCVAIYHCYRWLGEFPWNEGNLHPFNEVFDKYLEISPWSDLVKDKADTGVIIGIEKVLYRVLPKSVFIHIFKWAHERMLKKAEKDARVMKTNRSA